MKKIIIIVAIFLFSPTAFSAGGSGEKTIGQIGTDIWGSVEVKPSSGAWLNPDMCTNSNIFKVRSWMAQYKVLVASILSAKASGDAISAWFSGCDVDGLPVPTKIWQK